jgi:hypothetical protein
MKTISCARCGKEVDVPLTGRRPLYCSSACRVASLRKQRAVEATPAAQVPAPRNETLQRSSYGRGLGDGDDCPQDRGHGSMYFVDAAKSRQWCPSSRHQGNSFYARDGVTPALPASAPDTDPRDQPSRPRPEGTWIQPALLPAT